VAVAADQDLDPGPVGANTPDQPPQEGPDLAPVGPFCRPDHRRDQPSGVIEHEDRLEAIVVVVGIEEPQLLMAVDGVESVVDIEHDALGHLRKGAAVQVDQRPAHPQQRADLDGVLHTRDRGLRAQRRLGRQVFQRHLERGIEPQARGIVAVLIAGGDHQHAEAQDRRQALPPSPAAQPCRPATAHTARMPGVLQAPRQPVGQAEPLLDLPQQQLPAIRGHLAAIKAGDNALAGDR